MAKQKSLRDENGDIAEEAPPEVQAAADEYVKAMRTANKAKEKLNGAKDHCIQVMQEHNCTSVRIDEGSKMLRLDDEVKLKTEKIKPPKVDVE